MNDPARSISVSGKTPDRLGDLRDLVDRHVVKTLRWYSNHTRWPRITFRVLGSLAIVLSISLPFLSTLPSDKKKDLVISIVALAIALLSAFTSFFRWDESWRTNMQAKLELENLLASWELDLIEAQRHSDYDEQVEAAIVATKDLFAKAARVDTLNTEGYFKNVAFPSTAKR